VQHLHQRGLADAPLLGDLGRLHALYGELIDEVAVVVRAEQPAQGLYACSALLVGGLLCYRLLTPIGRRGRTYPKLAGLVALLLVGGVLWTATGPAQPGWNAIANNGQGSGARRVQAARGQTTGSVFAAPFAANLQGTLTRGRALPAGRARVARTGLQARLSKRPCSCGVHRRRY
jgi:hypothetical protein